MERAFLAIALAYLLGSIPFAYIVARWRTGLDIRYVGEGNMGGRNVFHVVGARWGMLVAILDVGKGYGACLAAQRLSAPLWAVLVSGFAVALGHGFPLFLGGRGGKGVGVSVGYLLRLTPLSTLAGGALFGLAHLVLKDFNRSVMVGVAAVIFLPLAFGQGWGVMLFALALFLALGVKKTLDLSHERKVWATSPWQDGAKPGWYREEEIAPEVGENAASSTLLGHQREAG